MLYHNLEIDFCKVCHQWVLNQEDLLGSVFSEVVPDELLAEIDSAELEAEVASVVLFQHSSSSSTAMTHLQLNVRKPSLFLKDIYSILLA